MRNGEKKKRKNRKREFKKDNKRKRLNENRDMSNEGNSGCTIFIDGVVLVRQKPFRGNGRTDLRIQMHPSSITERKIEIKIGTMEEKEK